MLRGDGPAGRAGPGARRALHPLHRRRGRRGGRGLPRRPPDLRGRPSSPSPRRPSRRVAEVDGSTDDVHWIPVRTPSTSSCCPRPGTRCPARPGVCMTPTPGTPSFRLHLWRSRVLKFGPAPPTRSATTSLGYGVGRVLLVTDPGVAATGHPHGSPTRWPRGPRGNGLRRCPGRADRREHPAGDRVRPRYRAVRRLRGSGGWLRDRHRQGRQPDGQQPRRPARLRQRPGRRRPRSGAPAAPAGRGADHHRHRQREHHDLRPRQSWPST